MSFDAASNAALIASILARTDDATFAVIASAQGTLFQPIIGATTLPGSFAITPRTLARSVVYSGSALYRMNRLRVFMVADSAFGDIATGLVAAEVNRQMDAYDLRYPKTPTLYSPQRY